MTVTTAPFRMRYLASMALLASLPACWRAVTPLAERDAGVDAADATVVMPPEPRPIAPLSTATVTSRRPVLRWELPSGTDGARVELCRDRACTHSLATFDATGTTGVPASELPPGVVFWRLRGRTGDVVSPGTSATWQFNVGARSAPVNTSWGTTLDVNGDGFADVAVGAWGANATTGRVYVYLGSAAGLATTPATTLDGLEGVNGDFGRSVASAGDVNGDGFADLIVSSDIDPAWAYVFSGSPDGLITTPASVLARGEGFPSDSTAAVASAGDVNGDGYADVVVNGRVFPGSASGTTANAVSVHADGGADANSFGSLVASALDANGDGFADLVVADCLSETCSASSASVYTGSASGLATTPVTTFAIGTRVQFGSAYAFAAAGDVNGDGYADILVASPTAQGIAGRVDVYFGGAAGLGPRPTTTLPAPDAMVGFGEVVAGAGDVDGDGYDDVVVEAGGRLAPTSSSIVALVFAGSARGPAPTPVGSLQVPLGPPGTRLAVLLGTGDINGDGFADLLAGQPHDVDAFRETESVYAYPGSAAGLVTAPTATLRGPSDSNGYFGGALARVRIAPSIGPVRSGLRRTSRAPG